MLIERLLSCSQKVATFPYSKAFQSRLPFYTLFPHDPFIFRDSLTFFTLLTVVVVVVAAGAAAAAIVVVVVVVVV
jgi:hypothetical protein